MFGTTGKNGHSQVKLVEVQAEPEAGLASVERPLDQQNNVEVGLQAKMK